MAVTIKLKNSVTQDAVPTTTHLPAVGELALNANINSLGIYMRASDNSIVKMAGPGSVSTVAASTTVAGIAELATSAETTTGTDTARVTTPAGVKAVTDAERATSNSTYLALAGGTLTGVLAATAGSNSAPSIHFGDTDSGIYGGTNTVSLAAGGTQGLTLNSDAYVQVPTRLSVGAVGPSEDIHIQTSSPSIRFVDTDATGGFAVVGVNNTSGSLILKSDDTNALANSYMGFEVDGSESARINSSGRFLIGQSASVNVGSTTAGFLQVASSTGSINSSFAAYGNNSSPCMIAIGRSRSGTVGSVGTALQEDDVIGLIRFAGDDGTDLQSQAASIAVEVDGAPGSNDMPGRLVFSTTADDANTPTERLRITSTGMVKVFGDLYLDNGTNAGKDIHWDESNNYLNFSDDVKAVFGGSNDLQVYHDGSNSYLANDTGQLNIDGASGDAIRFLNNGNYQCNIGSTGLNFPDDKKIRLGDSEDLEIYHDGSNNNIKAINGHLNVYLGTGKSFSVGNSDFSEDIFRATENGAVSLYYDSSLKFETTSAGTKLGDGVKAQFGTGADCDIYHTGSHMVIENDVGNTYIYGNRTAGEQGVTINRDGSVELYYNGSKRSETTSSGFSVPGGYYLEVPHDSGKLTLGAGTDLEIFHDGTDSWVKNITGKLRLCNTNGNGNEVKIGAREDQDSIIINPLGSTEIYHNGSKKFNTHSGGVTVTGYIQMDGTEGSAAAGNIYLEDNGKLVFGSAGGPDLQIYHDSNHSYVEDIGTGDLVLKAQNFNIHASNGTSMAYGVQGAQFELYHAGNKKLETTTDGITIGGDSGVTGNWQLETYNGSGNCGNVFAGVTGAYLYIQDTGSSEKIGILANGRASITSYKADDPLVLSTTDSNGTSDRLIIEGDGDIRIPQDNKVLSLGAGDDLQMYHTGTATYIKNITGDFIIQGVDDKWLSIEAKAGEKNILCKDDGSTELYYDNSKKFETTSYGTRVYGQELIWLGSSGGSANTGASLTLEDDTHHYLQFLSPNNKEVGILFGDSDDNNVGYITYSHTNNAMYFGAVAAAKLTISTNVSIPSDSTKLRLGVDHDIQIYHDGSNSFIEHDGGGNLYIDTHGTGEDIYIRSQDNLTLMVNNNSHIAVECVSNSAVQLYHANSKKFETTTDGIKTSGRAEIDGNCFPYSDNNNDLGLSGNRWQDLYLSGNIYLGGTGEDNALSDYEKGTWTPTIQGSGHSYTTNQGKYTKIGNRVLASFYINLGTLGTTASGVIEGLPFTAGSVTGGATGSMTLAYYQNLASNYNHLLGYTFNTANLQFYGNTSESEDVSATSPWKSSSVLQATIMYSV